MDNQDQQISKKLVNDPKNSVQESLEGFALTHAHVKLLKGHNVVVRSDLELFKKEGKVSLVTGKWYGSTQRMLFAQKCSVVSLTHQSKKRAEF